MSDLLLHPWLPDPHGRDQCDHKGDDDGQRRTCGRPAREHLDQQPIGSLPTTLPVGLTAKREGPYIEITDPGSENLLLVEPDAALALARAIVLAVHQTERGPDHG